MRFDLITLGRVGVDLYPLQSQLSLRKVESFGKFLGGSPTNVAVAAARYGRAAAVITRTGADPFGAFIRDALREFGVDDRWVTAVSDLPTPVTFCEVFPPDDFPVYFYRFPKAPDLEISAHRLDLSALREAHIVWATVTGLTCEPSRTATLTALATRGRNGLTVLDLDYRPGLWSSRREARYWTQEALQSANVVIGNLDECDMAVGKREPDAAAAALRARGVDLAVVKRGPHGVMAESAEAKVDVPPTPVEVVNGLGAGDAFGGAMCHGLLAGWPLEEVIRFASAAGAIVASRLSCAEAMPNEEEVRAAMAVLT